jgi:ubiquinone biosynthesis protein Coq4
VWIHDLHHVVTGYATDLAGESEIGAWELASNCLRFLAATVLNLFALGIGLVIAPLRVMRAWARGHHTRNLYRKDGVEHLLPRTVAEMRAELGLDAAPSRVRVRDALSVIALAMPMLAIMAAPLLAVLALLHAVL